MSGGMLIRAVIAQARAEIVLTLRRGESVLVTIVIPAALLAFFASARLLPSDARSLSFLLPGTLALAVISTGLVSLGIATAYERYYGVLKRFGATPFPRAGLVAAKLLAVAALEALQVVLLALIAVAFGWHPAGSAGAAIGFLLLGTAAFAGLGLLLAGTLRAEATLAIANGVFLFFLLLGGLFVPLSHLPAGLAALARALPAYALADVLRAALSSGVRIGLGSALVLTGWAVGAPLLAALTFRWE
jgi:ABC-2 type transport system permease protein